MKITAITFNIIEDTYHVRLDNGYLLAIADPTGLEIGDEIELAIRKRGPSGSIEHPVREGAVDSTAEVGESGGVRAPDGKSDQHF